MTHTKTESKASAALEAMGARPTPARIGVVEKHLAEVDGVVQVVDADGNVRLGAGDRPWTIRVLVEWILQDRDGEDARILRWKPFGKSIVCP